MTSSSRSLLHPPIVKTDPGTNVLEGRAPFRASTRRVGWIQTSKMALRQEPTPRTNNPAVETRTRTETKEEVGLLGNGLRRSGKASAWKESSQSHQDPPPVRPPLPRLMAFSTLQHLLNLPVHASLSSDPPLIRLPPPISDLPFHLLELPTTRNVPSSIPLDIRTLPHPSLRQRETNSLPFQPKPMDQTLSR